MTNIDNLTKAAMKTLSFNWLPQIRVAVPELTRKGRVAQRVITPVSRLERDDLMELFQSDLSDMTSLSPEEEQRKVIPMRKPIMRPFTGVGQAA